MKIEKLVPAFEAILFASGDPVSIERFTQVFDITPEKVNKVIDILKEKMDKNRPSYPK